MVVCILWFVCFYWLAMFGDVVFCFKGVCHYSFCLRFAWIYYWFYLGIGYWCCYCTYDFGHVWFIWFIWVLDCSFYIECWFSLCYFWCLSCLVLWCCCRLWWLFIVWIVLLFYVCLIFRDLGFILILVWLFTFWCVF